jgi:hypothetical protein
VRAEDSRAWKITGGGELTPPPPRHPCSFSQVKSRPESKSLVQAIRAMVRPTIDVKCMLDDNDDELRPFTAPAVSPSMYSPLVTSPLSGARDFALGAPAARHSRKSSSGPLGGSKEAARQKLKRRASGASAIDVLAPATLAAVARGLGGGGQMMMIQTALCGEAEAVRRRIWSLRAARVGDREKRAGAPRRASIGSTMSQAQFFIEAALPRLAASSNVSPRSSEALLDAGAAYASVIDGAAAAAAASGVPWGHARLYVEAAESDADEARSRAASPAPQSPEGEAAQADEQDFAANTAAVRSRRDSMLKDVRVLVSEAALRGILDPRCAQLVRIAPLAAFVTAHSPAPSPRAASPARRAPSSPPATAAAADDGAALADARAAAQHAAAAAPSPELLAHQVLARIDELLSLSVAPGGRRQTVVIERFARPEDAFYEAPTAAAAQAGAAAAPQASPRDAARTTGLAPPTGTRARPKPQTAASQRPQFPPGDLRTIQDLASKSTRRESALERFDVAASSPAAPFLAAMSLGHLMQPAPAGSPQPDSPRRGEGFWPERMFDPRTYGLLPNDERCDSARRKLARMRLKQAARKRDEDIDRAYVGGEGE